MGFIQSLKEKFGKNAAPPPPMATPVNTPRAEPAPAPSAQTVAQSVATASSPSSPAKRRVISAPLLMENAEKAADSGEIKIKAEPSRAGDECKFMVNRPVLERYSWYFKTPESAQGSPLAEKLFAMDPDVETVLFYGTTLTLTRKNKYERNWEPLAKKAGAVIREHLMTSEPTVAQDIVDSIASEEEIREKIQHAIDAEINPGVAGHGGVVTLLDVTGNTVTVEMGGGCQGCSAAAMTLKDGIEQVFRREVPSLGALLDGTDHSAGTNPYFS